MSAVLLGRDQKSSQKLSERVKESNLKVLEDLLPKHNMPADLAEKYIQCFREIRNVYSSCCRKNVDPNHRSVTAQFKNSWLSLFMDSRVNLSIPNKVHFIMDHFSDCFKDPLTGE